MSILNKLKAKKVKTQTNVDKTQTKADYTQTRPEGSKRKSAFSPRQSASLMRQAWVTEKASDLSDLRKYIFIVDKKASKPEVKKAIESIYGVKVVNVNVINIKGKTKRLGRSLGRTSAFRKAIVTLREGDKIDIIPT